MAKPARYLRGRCGITNWVCRGYGDQPPMMLSSRAWRDVDVSDSEISFNVQHDPKQHIGRNGVHGRIWIEPAAVAFEIDTESLQSDLARDLRIRVLLDKLRGSSPDFEIGEQHWAKFDGVDVLVVDRISKLNHLAVAEYGLCDLATIAVANESAFPMKSAKQKRKLLNVGPMPKGMRHGIALMNAASRGESCRINGRTIDATTVQAICLNAGPMSVH